MKKIAYWIFLSFFLIFTLGPFLWTFFLSITPEYSMFSNKEGGLFGEITWANYQTLFQASSTQGNMLLRGMYNSLRAVGTTFLIGLPLSVLSAYVLSRMEFKGRIWIKNSLLITMVIPVMATIIPIYRMFSINQLLDQIFWLSLVYVSSYLPMLTWLLSNYFTTIPKALEEAVYIDGGGRIRTFFSIILPLSYPILFTSALLIFLNTWSQFQIPLILASSTSTKPVAIVASEFMTKDTVQYGITAAGGILAMIPPAITALCFRKFLITGMTKGAVKS